MTCFFIFQFRRNRLGFFEPDADDVDVGFRSCDPAFAFLLEAVEDEDCFAELDGINGSICAAGVILDDFEDACATESFERLCGHVFLAELGF